MRKMKVIFTKVRKNENYFQKWFCGKTVNYIGILNE